MIGGLWSGKLLLFTAIVGKLPLSAEFVRVPTAFNAVKHAVVMSSWTHMSEIMHLKRVTGWNF